MRLLLATALPIGLSTLFLFASACAPPPYTPDAEDSGSVDADAIGIQLLYPSPEVTVTGCAMVVAEITGLTLISPPMDGSPPEAVEGQGHWHISYADTYQICTKPYCLVGFDETTGDGPLLLTAALVDNLHSPVLDADDKAIEAAVPVNVTLGECTEGTPVPY